MNSYTWQYPLSARELTRVARHLFRERFFTFLGMAALIYVPVLIGEWLIVLQGLSISNVFALPARWHLVMTLLFNVGYLCLYFLVGQIVNHLVAAAIALAVAHWQVGQHFKSREMYRFSLRQWMSLISTGALIGSLRMLVAIVFLASSLFVMLPTSTYEEHFFRGGLFGSISVFLLVAVLLISAQLAFVAQVIALEKRTALEALLRSWRLTRGQFRYLLGRFVKVFLPYVGLRYLVSGNLLVASLVDLVAHTYIYIFVALLYFDLRTRKGEIEPQHVPQGGTAR